MKTRHLLSTMLVLSACSSRGPEPSTPKAAAPEPIRATVWTDKGELFLEYPPLVVGQKVRFAIHLTRFSDFRAIKEGTCVVHLNHEGASEEVFPCDPSTHPGIFGANVQPKTPGDARMSVELNGRELTERFDVGPVKIAADSASAQVPEENAKEETIAFSKEQQWSLDFGTQLVAEQTLRESLRVAGETLPRTGGEANVIAPLAGRVVLERNLRIGAPVTAGIELAGIVPPTSSASDLATLQLAEAEAKVALDFAQKDRERAERLLAAGAVPARRLDQAKATEATAQARIQAAQIRLAQYDATRNADGGEAGGRRFIVRAPISGILSEASAIGGSNVEVGTVLFRIVDTESLYVSGIVPESEYSRLRQLSGAEIEMPDSTEVRTARRLVSVGRLVDSATRTVPVIYEVDNRDRRLAVNQTVFLRLLLTPSAKSPVVPESAIVDDAGRPIVFVQIAGEKFARRPVKVGLHSGGVVQVLDGVKPSERVVTKGAYLIRLSTLSNQIPAHGHVH